MGRVERLHRQPAEPWTPRSRPSSKTSYQMMLPQRTTPLRAPQQSRVELHRLTSSPVVGLFLLEDVRVEFMPILGGEDHNLVHSSTILPSSHNSTPKGIPQAGSSSTQSPINRPVPTGAGPKSSTAASQVNQEPSHKALWGPKSISTDKPSTRTTPRVPKALSSRRALPRGCTPQ